MDGTFNPCSKHPPAMERWQVHGPGGHPAVAVTVTRLPAGTLHTPGTQLPPGKEAVNALIIGPWTRVRGNRGTGVGVGVGVGVGDGAGEGLGVGVGLGEGVGLGAGVADGVGTGVGAAVGTADGAGSGAPGVTTISRAHVSVSVPLVTRTDAVNVPGISKT